MTSPLALAIVLCVVAAALWLSAYVLAALARRVDRSPEPTSEPGDVEQLTTQERAVWLLAIRRARHEPPESDVVPGPETRAVQRAFDEERLRNALYAACHPYADRRHEPAAQA